MHLFGISRDLVFEECQRVYVAETKCLLKRGKLILGESAILRKATVIFFMSVHPCVRQYETNRLLLKRIFMKFHI